MRRIDGMESQSKEERLHFYFFSGIFKRQGFFFFFCENDNDTHLKNILQFSSESNCVNVHQNFTWATMQWFLRNRKELQMCKSDEEHFIQVYARSLKTVENRTCLVTKLILCLHWDYIYIASRTLHRDIGLRKMQHWDKTWNTNVSRKRS